MYSAIVDGKVLDFKYRRINDFTYGFYIGCIYVGQVFNMKRYWSCVAASPNELGSISGFKNRYYASEMLLKMEGYYV